MAWLTFLTDALRCFGLSECTATLFEVAAAVQSPGQQSETPVAWKEAV